MADEVNPYRAPEASISMTPAVVRLPPAHESISIVCWFGCVLCLLMGGGCVGFLGWAGVQFGWREAWLAGPGPRVILVAIPSLLGAAAYFSAVRSLKARRGRLGLASCGLAVGLTYLAAFAFLLH